MSPVASLFGAAGSLLFGKKPKTPAPTIQPRVDSAAEAADKRDMLSRRRGAAANLLTGKLGAESKAGKKSSLGM